MKSRTLPTAITPGTPAVISLRRRHLIISGIVGAVAPGALFAAQCNVISASSGQPQLAEVFTSGTDETLLISGRVLGIECKPLAGARVEVWYSDPDQAFTATTDGDGRFMLTTIVPSGSDSRSFKISVSQPDGRTLTVKHSLTREHGSDNEALAHLHRDEAGVWRTTLGLSLA